MAETSASAIPQSPVHLPLQGIRVLDLTRVFAGPQCTMVLADLGADVLKVEHHIRGDDTRDWGIKIGKSNTTYFNTMNRNKRSLALNLDSDEGKKLLERLVVESDVLVHNFKRGDDAKFGISPDDIRRLNPRLIHCSISGYPSWSSERDRPGYDVVIQAESGLMQINGGVGKPPTKIVIALVDLITGMCAAQSILGALLHRSQAGEGAFLEQSLSDAGLMVTGSYALDALRLGKDPEKYGNDHASIVPYGMFEAADGHLIIAAGNNGLYKRLCLDVLECPALWENPDYQTNLGRMANRQPLLEAIGRILILRKRDELLQRLKAAGIPCGEVAGIHEAVSSERTAESGILASFTDADTGPYAVIAPPYIVNGTRLPIRRPPPKLGEHSAEALKDFLGLKDSEIRSLIQAGTVTTP